MIYKEGGNSPSKGNEMPSTLKDTIANAVVNRAPDKWPTYDGRFLDRTKYVTSSEVSLCELQLWFRKNGYDAQQNSSAWGFFERGHNVEAWVVDNLRQDKNAEYLYVGKEQRSFYDGCQSGTPDGLMKRKGVYTLLEIKSIDPRTNTRFLPKEAHRFQTVQNMDLVMACLDIEIAESIILYVNASDYSAMEEYQVPFEGDLAAQLEKKANRVMTLAEGEAKPEGMTKGGCEWCEFKHHCSAALEAKNIERAKVKSKERIANAVFQR